jgi:hypothetical protein
MAFMDYDYGHKFVGRIEVVEKYALQEQELPANFKITKEEQQYTDWLRKVVNGTSGNQLLRNIFFHGVSTQASLFIRGEVA